MQTITIKLAIEQAIKLFKGFADGTAQATELHHYAPKTAYAYMHSLLLFKESTLMKEFANQHYNDITYEILAMWLTEQAWSKAKSYQMITALRKMGAINQIPFIAALSLKSPKVRKAVQSDTLYAQRELQIILDAPLRYFGLENLQKRNKAMFAIVFANLASLETLRATHIEDVSANHIVAPFQKITNNTYQVPQQVMKIIHDHIDSIPENYPGLTIKSHHPLFFRPRSPSKALSGKCVWQNMSKTLERLFESKKYKGSGEGITALRLSIARSRYAQGCDSQLLLAMLGLKETYPSLPQYLKADEKLEEQRLEAIEKLAIYF